MKKVIENNSRIRLTANGQSVVEGSFAKVSAIEGKSVSVGGTLYHSSIKGIYSQNRNFVPKDKSILDYWAGEVELSQDLIDLMNSGFVSTLSISQKYRVKSFKKCTLSMLRLGMRFTENNVTNSILSVKQYLKIGETTERKIIYKIKDQSTYKKENAQGDKSVVWFNDFSTFEFTNEEKKEDYISYNNQIEFSETPTRFTEQRISQLDFPTNIILRSTKETVDEDGNYLRDVYFPELGIISRNVDTNCNPLATPTTEIVDKVAFCGYQVFNNGYEKILTDDENSLKNGATPIVHTTYIQEERQGADNSRFDFFMIDGESFSGIGYEQLKTTNQLTYEQSPSRQSDGSMENIEDYNSFVIGASDIGFSLIHPDTYVRLKEKLCSKRTFEVSYYDKDFDRFVTKEMYVKPIDLDNFLSLGDKIIGMKGVTISFVPTLNETTEYTATFYTNDNQQYQEPLSALFGRAITTPELPSGYNYWLIKESGFNSGNFHTIKGNKKLNLFGNTKLVAIK